MYELLFTVCLNYVCTIRPIDHPMTLAECMAKALVIEAGAGSLNCVIARD